MRVDEANRLKQDRSQRKIIKQAHWMLLRNPDNLPADGKIRLHELLNANRGLMTVYVMKAALKNYGSRPVGQVRYRGDACGQCGGTFMKLLQGPSGSAGIAQTLYDAFSMNMHFDLTDIRLFVNIAEENSLTRGAERSHMSLPAASTRIKHLEDGVGTKLLVRTGQGVTLTVPGQAFLHHARLVLQQLEYLRSEMQDYVQGMKGHIRVYANTTAITEFLPQALPAFLATHPDVSVDLRERLSHDIVRAVSEGKADIGIVAGNVRTEGLQVLPYREDRLVLATALGHPLAAFETTSFEQTLDFEHVSLQETSAIQAFVKNAADALNKPLLVRIQVGNFEALCRMVEENVGIGILPQSSAQRHAQTMAIRIVQLSDEWALRKLQICVRSAGLLPHFARELLEMLVADSADRQQSKN